MPNKKRTVLSTCAECLALLSFVLAIVVLAVPNWATFKELSGSESGNFGPWIVCKDTLYNKVRCGRDVSNYSPPIWTTIAGVIAAMGAVCIGCACIVGAFVILMNRSKVRVCMPYKPAVVARLVLCALAALLAAVGAGVFNLQNAKSPLNASVLVQWSWAYYLQLVVVGLEILLALFATLDFWQSRKLGGDPTLYSRDPSGQHAVTIDNPGFRDENGRPAASAPGPSPKIIRSSTSRHSSRGNKSSNGVHSSRSSHRTHRGTSTTKKSGIAFTSSSGDPYIYVNTAPNPPSNGHPSGAGRQSPASDSVDGSVSLYNGSMGSIATTTNSVLSSNGSTSFGSKVLPVASPLKSSIRKPKNYQLQSPTPDLNNSVHSNDTTSTVMTIDGIPNPGFSAASPTPSRNGTIKRVRIHTQSTEV